MENVRNDAVTLVTSANLRLDSAPRDERRIWDSSPADKIVELSSAKAPFFTMSSRVGTEPTDDVDFRWLETYQGFINQPTFYVKTVTGLVNGSNIASSDRVALMTFCSADDAGDEITVPRLEVNSVFQTRNVTNLTASNQTLWLVQSITGTDYSVYCITYDSAGNYLTNHAPTVSNDVEGGVAGDPNIIIGNAFGEYSSIPDAHVEKTDMRWGSCQIFKTTCKISNTALKTTYMGGDEWTRIKEDGLTEHKVLIERSLLFGERYGTDGAPYGSPSTSDTYEPLIDATNHVKMTAGLKQLIGTSEVVSEAGETFFGIASASYTYESFIDDMRIMAHREDTMTKVCFAGDKLYAFFQKLAWRNGDSSTTSSTNSPIRITNSPNTYGLKIDRIETGAMSLNLVLHPLLVDEHANYGFIVDMAYAKLKVFRPTEWKDNVLTQDYDGRTGFYLTQIGLKLEQPRKHGMFLLLS